MPPQDPQSDQDFLKANPKDQHAYLMATDPDYAKAPGPDQAAYLNHLAPQSQGEEHTLTSATDPGAEAFDKAHPILGKGVRMLSAAGGAAMGLPGAMYHAVTDPLTPEEEQDFKGHTRIPGEVGLERLTGARQMVNAGKDYASGKVSPGAAMSVLPEAIGQGVGTVGAVEGARMAGPAIKSYATGLPGRPGQIGLTAAKTLENFDVTKPAKTFGKIGDYWRESSPAGRMLAETKRAVAERRASMIPTRIPGSSMQPSATPTPGGAEAGPPSPMLVPEPRTQFPGENEGYMASVPRPDLNKMALSRKPGAATQLQQLGQPIIYIPSEADYPGPRR